MIFFQYKYLLFILSFINLISCSNKGFEREAEIITLLKSRYNIDLQSEDYNQFVILQDGICGACTGKVMSFIEKLDPTVTKLILSGADKKLNNRLIRTFGKSNLLIDRENNIVRYGLRYADNVLIVFKKNKIVYWSFLDSNTVDSVSNQIQEIANKYS